MSRWRILIVAILIVLPFVILAGWGSYFLWKEGWGLLLWLSMTACTFLGYSLAIYWHKKNQLLKPVDFTPPLLWTDRDKEAWQIVHARAEKAAKLDANQLGEISFYIDTATELAQDLARFYHPRAVDPVSSLTIPELLAVVELAAHDLAEMVDRYLPGGHLLCLQDWRRARQAADWYDKAGNAYWMVSAVLSPVNTAVRYVATQLGVSRPFRMLQNNLIAWFVTAYVHRVGTYLIEVNSGRLRVGATRYRELRATLDSDQQPSDTMPHPTLARSAREGPAPAKTQARSASEDPSAAKTRARSAGDGPTPAPSAITLTVLGQAKSGKSSLINAVLGNQLILADVVAGTSAVTTYGLQPPESPSRLKILDTSGYGRDGPEEDQLRATMDAASQSDLLLLVLHARNPARKSDADVLEQLRTRFASQPEIKMPPILGIMTHIDLLSPAMEWSPPYDWVDPQRPKEHQIHQAWQALREQLGDYLVGIVPVCTAPGRIYGIEEWFWPTLAELLGEARSVALLRCIRAEANTDKIRKVVRQLLASGGQAAKVLRAVIHH